MRPLLVLLVLLPVGRAAAQPTVCEVSPAAYAGPCYHGALPAFFDDFDYAGASTTAPVERAGEGDLFGSNVWHTRTGAEQTRAWYRYNLGDLVIPGTVTFDTPSVLEMTLPGGHRAADHLHDPRLMSGFTARSGTWHWRVRLSELWPGQRVRHALWAMSPAAYVFDRPGTGERYRYWSEIDFENENHFQGTWHDGVFHPDWVPRMYVGNHYGKQERPPMARLGTGGAAGWEEGRGFLVRGGFGRTPAAMAAPHVASWADPWLHLIAEVDDRSRTVTYRMIPEGGAAALQVVAEEVYTAGPSFYPTDSMHVFLSMHWIEAEGALQRPLTLEADWFYYTPVTGLTDAGVRAQVEHFRRRDLRRVNTTGRPTFEDWARRSRLELRGPSEAACGEPETWTLTVTSGGIYHVTYRYRLVQDGTPGPWRELYERAFTHAPRPGQAGLELEATAQSRWRPHGVERGPDGMLYPHPENHTARARRLISFDCGG